MAARRGTRGAVSGMHESLTWNRRSGTQAPYISACPLVIRRQTVTANVGGVPVGSGHPIVVQSMTNTDTADVAATVRQVAALARRGQRAGAGDGQQRSGRGGGARHRGGAGPARRARCPSSATSTTTATSSSPGIPTAPRALAKYRINPGNVGGKRHDENFRAIVEVALANDKPVRIGVNWGSLDQNLLTEMMDANARSADTARRARRHHGGDGGERAPLRRARRGRGHAARPHRAQRQGVRRAGPGRRVSHARGALRLPAAPRPHRGRDSAPRASSPAPRV